MCEGARQQEALMTYERELWEFPEGFWELDWSWLNGSVIYLYHSLHCGLLRRVCVCVNVSSVGILSQDMGGCHSLVKTLDILSRSC